jgi:hypothetical protein
MQLGRLGGRAERHLARIDKICFSFLQDLYYAIPTLCFIHHFGILKGLLLFVTRQKGSHVVDYKGLASEISKITPPSHTMCAPWRASAKQVSQCFRCIERAANRLTGAVGKFFVTLAVILLVLGTGCFCASFVSRPHPRLQVLTVQSSRRHMALPPISYIRYPTLPPHHRQLTPPLSLRMCRVTWLRGRTTSVARERLLLGQETTTAHAHDDAG